MEEIELAELPQHLRRPFLSEVPGRPFLTEDKAKYFNCVDIPGCTGAVGVVGTIFGVGLAYCLARVDFECGGRYEDKDLPSKRKEFDAQAYNAALDTNRGLRAELQSLNREREQYNATALAEENRRIRERNSAKARDRANNRYSVTSVPTLIEEIQLVN